MSENLVPAAAPITSPMVPAQGQAADAPEQVPLVRVAQALTPEYIMKHAVTPAMRPAAAERAAARGLRAALGAEPVAQPPCAYAGRAPGYFGPYTNYANSPLPAVDPVTGKVVPGTRIRKFINSLPGLGKSNANDFGSYIPVAAPDTITYPGCDYYEIVLERHTQKLHKDVPPTQRPRRRCAGPEGIRPGDDPDRQRERDAARAGSPAEPAHQLRIQPAQHRGAQRGRPHQG